MRLSFGLSLSPAKGLIACFALGFLVRLIPEALAYPHPIGFDTVYYAAAIRNGAIWPHWSSLLTSSWLLYVIILPGHALLGIDSFLLLKALAPVLFGLNVAGVYWFATKKLEWDARLSMLATGFFALQLATIRISWDLLRNTLGLGLLLFALPFIGKLGSKRAFTSFVTLSLLVIFAHEYAAITLLVVVVGLLAWRLVKKRVDADWKRLSIGIVPALAVFSTSILLRLSQTDHAAGPNVIETGDAAGGNVAGIPFLVNYLNVRSAVDSYATYWNLATSVLVLFTVLYMSYLLLVAKGFFKDEVLTLWVGLLVLGAFGCLLFPFFALEFWHRWMFMLAYPFTFYAVMGLRRVESAASLSSIGKRLHVSRWEAKLMVLCTVVLGVSYLATPVLMTYSNVSVSSITGTSPYFSTSPTVPYEDVDSVAQMMQWLNMNMNSDACVVLQHAFLCWGQLYLDDSHAIVHFETDAGKAVAAGWKHDFDTIYFVWWNVNIGWYGITVPYGFIRVHDCGRLSVYEYLE